MHSLTKSLLPRAAASGRHLLTQPWRPAVTPQMAVPLMTPPPPPASSTTQRRAIQVDTQKSTPPDPIEKEDAQAQPLGAYYEYILQQPQPIPEEKPEEPPASAKTAASPATPKSAAGKKKDAA